MVTPRTREAREDLGYVCAGIVHTTLSSLSNEPNGSGEVHQQCSDGGSTRTAMDAEVMCFMCDRGGYIHAGITVASTCRHHRGSAMQEALRQLGGV